MTGKFLKRKLNKVKKWVLSRPYEIRRTLDKRRVKNKDFTIISNNCWAGKAYQYLDLPYLTPTVGLYFFAEDYLKFVKNLNYYLSLELQFIDNNESKYVDYLKDRNHMEVPIGILDDIEIVFLHYSSKEEAKVKWEKRKQRVNYSNIIIKFSKMNGCTETQIKDFDEIDFKNKFVLNNRKNPVYDSEMYWDGKSNEVEILSDTSPFPGNLNISNILNCSSELYPSKGFE